MDYSKKHHQKWPIPSPFKKPFQCGRAKWSVYQILLGCRNRRSTLLFSEDLDWIFVIWISGFYSAENHRYRCWFPPHPRLSCNTSSNHGKYCKLVQFIDFTVQCVIHYHLSPNGCSVFTVLSAINAWLQCVIRYHRVTAVRYPLSPDCP